jgi:hypothetical protein
VQQRLLLLLLLLLLLSHGRLYPAAACAGAVNSMIG